MAIQSFALLSTQPLGFRDRKYFNTIYTLHLKTLWQTGGKSVRSWEDLRTEDEQIHVPLHTNRAFQTRTSHLQNSESPHTFTTPNPIPNSISHPIPRSIPSVHQNHPASSKHLLAYQVAINNTTVWICNEWDALAFLLTGPLTPLHRIYQKAIPGVNFYSAMLSIFSRWDCVINRRFWGLQGCVSLTHLSSTSSWNPPVPMKKHPQPTKETPESDSITAGKTETLSSSPSKRSRYIPSYQRNCSHFHPRFLPLQFHLPTSPPKFPSQRISRPHKLLLEISKNEILQIEPQTFALL